MGIGLHRHLAQVTLFEERSHSSLVFWWVGWGSLENPGNTAFYMMFTFFTLT